MPARWSHEVERLRESAAAGARARPLREGEPADCLARPACRGTARRGAAFRARTRRARRTHPDRSAARRSTQVHDARFFRSSAARKPGRERFDDERERKSFVAELDARRAAASRPVCRAESTRGSSVARPSASTSQGPFSRSPLAASRLFIALVDVELLMSMRIGSPPVGNPAAIGFGVMRDATPPCGVTPAADGSEHISTMMRPASVTGFKYTCRQPM